MRRIAGAALVLCLLSGTSALAQDNDHHHDKAAGPPKGAGPTHGGPPAGPTVHALPVHPTGGPVGPVHPTGAFNPGHTITPTFQTGPTHPTGAFNPGNTHRSVGATGFRPGGARPQYNPQFFPRTFNSGHRFQWRGGNWSGPRGFFYRSWVFGQILPYGWYSSDWYINDYYDYGLPQPPYGYEWIRNGPDALMVNIANGEVVESAPGVFY